MMFSGMKNVEQSKVFAMLMKLNEQLEKVKDCSEVIDGDIYNDFDDSISDLISKVHGLVIK